MIVCRKRRVSEDSNEGPNVEIDGMGVVVEAS